MEAATRDVFETLQMSGDIVTAVQRDVPVSQGFLPNRVALVRRDRRNLERRHRATPVPRRLRRRAGAQVDFRWK